MKKLAILIIFLLTIHLSFAQILKPVKFDYSIVKKGSDLYEIHIKTRIEPHWHVYSVNNPDGGAQATVIKIKEGKVIGKVHEQGKIVSIHDAQFNVNQKYFENSVDFVETVKIKGLKTISGTIEYMVCNDHQCLPPKEVEFKIKI